MMIIAGSSLYLAGDLARFLIIIFHDHTEAILDDMATELQADPSRTRLDTIGTKLKANLKPVAKRVKEELKKRSGQLSTPHIFLDFESLWAGPYAVDVDAMTRNPALSILNYKLKSDGDKRDLRDDLKAFWGPILHPGQYPNMTGDFHEYPFASTLQASMANSRGDWVDFTENRFQGTYLGWFIRTQLNSVDNEAYLVLPIPSAITPF